MSSPASPPRFRFSWLDRWRLLVLGLPCLVANMDLTILNLAVPTLAAKLHPTAAELLWIVDIYGFMIAGALVTMGGLSDRIGCRRLLFIGAVAFMVACVLAVFAQTPTQLITARALLGVAGATFAPSTLSLIRHLFEDSDRRSSAVGIWAAYFSAGAAIGPLVGGFLLQHATWSSVFFVGIPPMVLVVALGSLLLPDVRSRGPSNLDLISAALALIGVLGLILGMKHAAHGGDFVTSFGSAFGGLVALYVFGHRQLHIEKALVDLRLFKNPAFSSALALGLLITFVSLGALLAIAQYLQLVLHLSPFEAGLLTIPYAAGFIAGCLLAPRLLHKVARGPAASGGCIVSSIGFCVLASLDGSDALAPVVAASLVIALGAGIVGTLVADIIIAVVPSDSAGAAIGVSETGAELGGALGIAILGSITAVVYRTHLTTTVPQNSLSTDQLRAAQESLGAAADVASDISGTAGELLVLAAREAFSDGMRTIAGISIVVTLSLAALAATKLRHIDCNPSQ